MSVTPAVLYRADVETVENDEAASVGELNKSFDTILETTAKDYHHAVRAVHAKAHAVLKGVLTVNPDLPPELAQGLFAKPGEHKVFPPSPPTPATSCPMT